MLNNNFIKKHSNGVKIKFWIKRLLIATFFVFFLLSLMVFWNNFQVKPTPFEIALLQRKFGNIQIKNDSDIFEISRKVVSTVKHEENYNLPLSVPAILNKGKGLCYDRSLVLQKIFIFNNIPIRPVYIYFSPAGSAVSVLNLLDNDLESHNVFEYYFDGEWYLMKTNHELVKKLKLKEYILKEGVVPVNSKYLRYLNNRNGQFIFPGWIPDVYYIN